MSFPADLTRHETLNKEGTRREEDGVPGTRREDASSDTPQSPHSTTVSSLSGMQLPPSLDQDYTLIEPLPAAGGEADLYLVRRKVDGKTFLLKLYRLGYEIKLEVLERVTTALPEHVVRLHAYGQTDLEPRLRRWYEIQEYCPRGSLRDYAATRNFTPDQVLELFKEIFEAIAHLHKLTPPVVHRDITPANILVRSEEPLNLVLADFGISSIVEESRRFTDSSRTATYAAPETFAGQVSKASDYWPLGMIVLELLTGSNPFAGSNENQIIAHLVAKPVDLEGITDPHWKLLCRGLLVRDHTQRWKEQEIRRWLVHDSSLCAPEDVPSAVEERNGIRVGGQSYYDATGVAAAFTHHWRAGIEKIHNKEELRKWASSEDTHVLEILDELERDAYKDISLDTQLFLFVTRVNPQLPPIYRGLNISISDGESPLAAVAQAAMQVHSEDKNAESKKVKEVVWLLYKDRVLELYGAQTGESSYSHAGENWRQSVASFESAITKVPRKVRSATHLSLDISQHNLCVLLYAALSDEVTDQIKGQAHDVLSDDARTCTWMQMLLADPENAGMMLAASLLAPLAESETQQNRDAEKVRQEQIRKREADRQEQNRHEEERERQKIDEEHSRKKQLKNQQNIRRLIQLSFWLFGIVLGGIGGNSLGALLATVFEIDEAPKQVAGITIFLVATIAGAINESPLGGIGAFILGIVTYGYVIGGIVGYVIGLVLAVTLSDTTYSNVVQVAWIATGIAAGLYLANIFLRISLGRIFSV